ncbi:BUD13 homolog [Toxorhynchites rutilus septentrionalis]|uniref:BUD13 homolog n=1 Tax=Toxorhynchites rutilus septentrionalis TaxID=329112 RepID=UPI00247905BC|nr:BUD13 homolog [Toxorhynchites rutilus septentrionalis]
MTTNKINQKEYLKRYLSNEKDSKKKKKKKRDKQTTDKSNVRIIDTDDFNNHIQPNNEDESDLFAMGDEAPQIVGIIDDRPPELKAKEDFNSSRWKKLSEDSGNSFTNAMSSKGKPMMEMWGAKKNALTNERSRADRMDSDESPPRRGKVPSHSKDLRNNSKRNSDESPPRAKKSQRYSDQMPSRERHRKSRSDSDESPPRSNKHRRERDLSGVNSNRSKQHECSSKNTRSDSDVSPPRRKGGRTIESMSRDVKREYDSDQSPPRRTINEKSRRNRSPSKAHKKNRQSNVENPRRKTGENKSRQGSDSDQSPPRKRQEARYGTSRKDSDESPPRRRQESRRRSDSDESPPRRVTIKQERNASPVRSRASEIPTRQIKQEPIDSDESPPRKPSKSSRHESRSRSRDRAISSGRMVTTLEGKRAGLQDARDLRVENERFRERENELFDSMSAEVSGRFAKTRVREKSGKRRDVEEELRKEFEKRKRDEKKKEVYTRWGKGVKQVEDYKTQLEEAAHEMSKPLARYANDEDLDDYLKKQERDGDPMLNYMRSKKKDKDRQEGRPEKPLYKGSFADNRFGIRPGYRWDGVDRSNGFEKKWFEMMSKKKAVEEEAYKYSVEDM